MKRLLVIALLAGQVVSPAGGQEDSAVQSSPVRFPHAPRSWLGLEVSKSDESVTVHLPELPPGIGFVVRSVDAAGPAQAAGLREYDLLWKLGDQMLVNEGQLAALLRLFKPGDEVVLTGFRGGKPLEVRLKLGEAPDSKHAFPGDLVDESLLPGECSGPMRVVNVAEKSARYTTDDGRAEVRKDGAVYRVKILGPKGEPVYDGEMPDNGGGMEKIPEPWRRRVLALCRGLDQALDGRMMPIRQPRPRVVPPSPGNP